MPAEITERKLRGHIGAERTKAAVVMMNLTYNLVRYEQIVRLDLMPLRG